MDTPSPQIVSVKVDPNYLESFAASLVVIRYQGTVAIIHSLFPLAGLALLVMSYERGFPQGVASPIACAMTAILFTPLLTAFVVLMARRNKLTRGPFIFDFDSDGVHTRGETFTQTINWTGVRKVRQSSGFLFIFISTVKALYIPVKALRDQGVMDEVRIIASQHSDFR